MRPKFSNLNALWVYYQRDEIIPYDDWKSLEARMKQNLQIFVSCYIPSAGIYET